MRDVHYIGLRGNHVTGRWGVGRWALRSYYLFAGAEKTDKLGHDM